MLVPADTWFAQPQLVDSIHGIRHNARVSLLAGLLAQEYGLDPDHTAALCTAAAVHDCRRRDDRDDPGHGRVVRSEQARLNGATNHGALIHASQLLNPRQ
ncbi:hypothetical protein [Kitasatospora purpeofusca]|uniref:hypothetical protein n=1 Tax=Kitasatospora purpeofusca TaxID=67352 RepID=UPI002253EECF|nr:hypothetical protein [Kitasatospora purpeofusca]MCX4752577.1 hypothetical protein [Kitasatospora purpeofusca]WSR32145.1 hypothetical protein OG715_14795 [Kitasatospora purpeofusca]